MWQFALMLGLLGAEQGIDDFSYGDAATARGVWQAKSGTPPVEVVLGQRRHGNAARPVLKVLAPFATHPHLGRTVIDRDARLNLASLGEFTLEIACDRPEAIEHLTLYFRSAGGWYGANTGLGRKDWQTVRFFKTSFSVEEHPAGWNKIDGIRIAAWRGQPIDATILVRRLSAVSHDVALVVPDMKGAKDGETAAARATADRLAAMLSQLGLGCDVVEQSAVAAGALGKRRVAVLAYNPRLESATVAALERYITAGGKVLVCYSMPARLAAALGFKRGEYFRRKEPGDLAMIRFDAPDILGLPKEIRQSSWNIATAEPVAYNARVIGRWYTAGGKPTGHAAMLQSDRGAYFSHIILSDDPEGKKQMLAAVLGHLDRSLWEQAAKAALEGICRIGHCGDSDKLQTFVESSRNRAASERVVHGLETRNKAAQLARTGRFPEAVSAARTAHSELMDAYLYAQPSPKREGRATWNHSGTGAYPGDWERSAKVLAENGFNMVLPNMLWGGRAHYPSDVLPRSSTFEKYGDQVEQCCDAAKKHGLEVHVWKVNYNLSGAPKDFVDRLRREGRLQRTSGGKEHPWLCPSHPENKKLELESMLEVARKYPVDGLHFDYIRYPGSDVCFCDGCRKRFEAELGRAVADWPRDCRRGSLHDRYTTWRCRQITDLVAAVHREAKKLRPDLKISAAVFGSYPGCRESVAQDWPEWVKAGLLDFICPMDYTNSNATFCNLVTNQVRLVDKRIPIYPGIGATASNSRLSADRVAGQIHHARRLGAGGFTIFNFSEGTARDIVPGVGKGVGAEKATPPHCGK